MASGYRASTKLQHLWDTAYSGVNNLSSDFRPVIKLDLIAEMCNIFKDERGENFRKLKEISSRTVKVKRGLDLVYDFLSNISPYITSDVLQTRLDKVGRLLDWCYLCKTSLPAWQAVSNKLLLSKAIFDMGLSEFCIFAQGLYRYDTAAYHEWFSQNRDDVIGYLKLKTGCIELNISDSALSIEFFLDMEGPDSDPNKALSRLNKLRSAIPFCERYQSQGIWFLPFGLKPSRDETCRDISQKYLHFYSDIKKDMIWHKIAESHYLPDSYYRYEDAWFSLRHDALLFVQGLSKGLQRTLIGKKFDFKGVFEGERLPYRLFHSMQHILNPPPQTPEHLRKSIANVTRKWSSSFQNFIVQHFQYAGDKSNQRIGRLSAINFRDAIKILPEMHRAFSDLFEIAPDYFQARELNAQENKAYLILADLLDAWILDPPKTPQRDIMQYLRARREQRQQEMLRRLKDAIAYLTDIGMTIVLPKDAYINHPLTYLPLAFSVRDPCYFDNELCAVLKALAKVKDIADFFCLVPIYQGARFLEGGYQFSSHQITELEEGRALNWEALQPRELEKKILHNLQNIPYQVSTKYRFKTRIIELIGAIETLVLQEKMINSMKPAQNRFEAELYRIHKFQLLKLNKDIGITASSIKECMNADLLSLRDNPSFRIIESYLSIVEEASKQESLDEEIIHHHFNTEDIYKAIELLLHIR